MGRTWFPRTLAEWKEPSHFARRRTAEAIKAWPWRGWFLFLGIFSLALMVPLCVQGDGFGLPPPAEAFKQLLGVLVMAAFPYASLLSTRDVWIREDAILVASPNLQRLPLEQLFRVIPAVREIDGRRTTILRLEKLDGRSVEVAVADTISLARIEEVLRAQGVRFGD